MKVKKKVTFISLIIMFLISSHIYGQKKNGEDKKFTDKLFFGGSIGLVIGQVTQIDILPMAGIWVTPQWSIGMTGRYSFYQQKFVTLGSRNSYRTHIWGGSAFTQILPIPDFSKIGVNIHGGLLVHAEYESLYLNRNITDPSNTDVTGKQWVKMYLIGGGYRQILGDRSALYILVLWDLSHNEYSPYSSNPLLRFSITF